MKCSNCGSECADGAQFCPYCGASMADAQNQAAQQTEAAQQPYVQSPQTAQQTGTAQQPYVQTPQPAPQPYTPPAQSININTASIPPEYQPISMWGYFGYELLFSIPCIGFIILLVFAFGGTSNLNVKNFARSYFCLLIVLLVFMLILALTGGAAVLFDSLGR